MQQHDHLHRYLFENFDVRGELVTLSENMQHKHNKKTNPHPEKTQQAQQQVATSQLTATHKI
ncbi:redox-regulated molecular chaperone Hsp33, partial [Salmonella enterica subsp. enterica serovar Weltevreden]|nr:redox-regulated molecular chaperone Hsp33 [Salmonella enterica subsp. enterica serovar Weltevreden]